MSRWRALEEERLLDEAPSLRGCWDELRPKLPPDRRWYAGELLAEELEQLVHCPSEAFGVLSGGSGSLRDSADRLAAGVRFDGEAAEPARWIRELAADFDDARAGSLVLGANDLSRGPFQLLDGNHRATAWLLALSRGLPGAPARLPAVAARSAVPLKPW